jgi:predicted transcriptional regulator
MLNDPSKKYEPQANNAQDSQKQSYLGLTADILTAYLSNNNLSSSELSNMIETIYASLSHGTLAKAKEKTKPKPMVPIEESITPEYLICLEDGKKVKLLRRYIKDKFDLSVKEYLERWDLPPDYPMVAPNYSAARSTLAKKNGLGVRPAADRSKR